VDVLQPADGEQGGEHRAAARPRVARKTRP
jgi:hypothetical protein